MGVIAQRRGDKSDVGNSIVWYSLSMMPSKFEGALYSSNGLKSKAQFASARPANPCSLASSPGSCTGGAWSREWCE